MHNAFSSSLYLSIRDGRHFVEMYDVIRNNIKLVKLNITVFFLIRFVQRAIDRGNKVDSLNPPRIDLVRILGHDFSAY